MNEKNEIIYILNSAGDRIIPLKRNREFEVRNNQIIVKNFTGTDCLIIGEYKDKEEAKIALRQLFISIENEEVAHSLLKNNQNKNIGGITVSEPYEHIEVPISKEDSASLKEFSDNLNNHLNNLTSNRIL